MTDKVKLSKMTGKLTGITGENTNPLTNEYCKKRNNSKCDNEVCKHCYSCYMLHTFRKSCINAFQHNTELLSKPIKIDALPVIKTELCRVNAHGELINDAHLLNIINQCLKNPNTTFSLFSKRLGIINRVLKSVKKPNNLIIVFSNLKIDKPIMSLEHKAFRHVDKIFNVVTSMPTAILLLDNAIHFCKGKRCNTCKVCYEPGERIIFEELRVKPTVNTTR